MITFGAIDGTPVHYWRNGRPNSAPRNWRCTQAFYDQLVHWMRDLRSESSAYGTISSLVSAGFYVDKPGQHGAGTAIDLDRVQWSDGTVCSPLDRDHASADTAVRRRYLAVDAVCRRTFRYVLDGWYNAAHEDHIHADIGGLPVLCRKKSSSDTKFVQAVCNDFGDAGLTVDGHWGPSTQTAFDAAKAALGVIGDPHTSTAVWQSTLSAIARLGFSNQPFPSAPQAAAALAPDCAAAVLRGKVAVVGGGLAGLMAARTLCRLGARVTVYEARAQVGGRVLSDYSSFAKGRITEFGAELVGSVHPMWCGLAKEYGISLIGRMSDALYRGQGLEERVVLDQLLTRGTVRSLGQDMDKVLRRIAELAEKEIRDPSRPWEQSTLVRFDRMTVADALVNLFGVPRNGQLWRALELLLVNNNVARLDEMNFLGLLCLVRGGQLGLEPTKKSPTIGEPLMGYWNELEIYRCGDGCQRLALELEAEINRTKGCRVVRRQAVFQINLKARPGGVVVTSTPAGDREIDKRKRELLPATPLPYDYVILAVPPTVWPDIEITPIHPKDVIGLMRSGAAVKFFSRVKERFWIKDGYAPLGGSLQLGQVWEGTDNQTRVKGQDTVLSVFAGARTPTEADFRRELAKLYPGYPKNVTGTRLVDWTRQPFVRTGYSAPGLGQIFTIGKELNEPFQGRMLFAGEHTQLDHFGYMEGALRSGHRAADMLVKLMCRPKDQQRGAQRSVITPRRSG